MSEFFQIDSGLLVPKPTYPTHWEITHAFDLDASIRCRLSDSHCAEFEALDWLGANDRGVPLFRSSKESSAAADGADDAEKLVSGHVKWDGCANYDFHTDEVMRHFCSVDDVRKFSSVLEAAYCQCARLLRDKGLSWDDGVVPMRMMYSAFDQPVLAKLKEAMRWATGSNERAVIVQKLVLDAKEILAKNGLEIETLT